MSKLAEYSDMVHEMIEADKERDAMFKRIDKIFNMDWELPPEIAALSWVYPVISSDGHDALRATTRVFAGREPSVTVWPGSDDPREREYTDMLEKAIKWFMHQAFQHGHGSALSDICMSASRYDEVVGQILYFPYQKTIMEGEGRKAGSKRVKRQIARKMEAMEVSGPFSFAMRNPRFVHTRYSDWGMEAVCHASIWKYQKVVDYFGHSANTLIKAKTRDKASEFYAVFDTSDYDERFAFCLPVVDRSVDVSQLQIKDNREVIELIDLKSDLGFIPWVCEMGGTNIEVDDENRRIPMLYSVEKSEQFDIQNIIHTTMLSESIAHAAAARGKKSGPGADTIEVGYGDPNRDVTLKPGQDYQRLEAPELDQGLFTMSEWITNRVEKSTVPRVLQGGNVPSQVFSTLNLAVESGMITIDPYKRVIERWLSKSAVQMLQWVAYQKEPLEVSVFTKDLEGSKNIDVFVIDPTDLPKNQPRIDFSLQTSVPVDKVSRINGANMMQQMGVSTRAVLEEVGETNATGLIEEAEYEAMEKFMLQRFFQKITAQDELAIQAQQQQLQMQAQAATMQMQMAAQQAAAAQEQQQGPPQRETRRGRTAPRPNPTTPPGAAGPGVEGQGFDPSVGGTPPAQAEPGTNQERQTGLTSGGQGLA